LSSLIEAGLLRDAIEIELLLNGERMQASSTADLSTRYQRLSSTCRC
jgi:hypothetical protein